MRVRFTPQARDDLRAILEFIDGKSPAGARNVKLALRRTIRLIGDFPECGRLAGEQSVRVLKTGGYPFLVYWSIERAEAWIVHIRHAHRKPWADETQTGGG